MALAAPALAEAFREHERVLWDVCFRMSGSAADADDLVQETFLRAAEHPPVDLAAPLRPWLVRVAMNRARDFLRARRRRSYTGPWLPSPVETADDSRGPEARYGMAESASMGFLLALEMLTPQQRAVLVLRDVFDFSVLETGEALGLKPDAVKATHLRARRAMAAYDESRVPPTAEARGRARAVLEQFMAAILTHDAAAMEALLAKDVRAVSDGGGEYFAALKPILGREKVARFFWGLTARAADREVRGGDLVLGGWPAYAFEIIDGKPGWAPRYTMQAALDAQGRIATMYVVLAPRKLKAVPFSRFG